MSKRLIVCLDGTWNSPDKGPCPTNVVKMMSAIPPEDMQGTPQIVFYDSGVGADAGQIDRMVDGVTGRGLDQNVRDGYRFLAHNYLPSDEIYIFGFSRGAFSARSLCGFMNVAGLLQKAEMGKVRDAWKLYQQPKEERAQSDLDRLHAASRRDFKVQCLGVWDTVGALGVPGEALQMLNREYRFHDAELSDLVEAAFHALAIDEKRGPFAPTLWQQPKGTPPGRQVIEQVWFPGVHSNIGGSYADAGISDLALEWMMGRVEDVSNLEFDAAYVEKAIHPNLLGEIYEFRSIAYTTSRLYPYQRLIGQAEIDGSVLRGWVERRNRPGEGCEFVNEQIHWSAAERFGQPAKQDGRDRRYESENLKAALDKKIPVVPRRPNRPGKSALAKPLPTAA